MCQCHEPDLFFSQRRKAVAAVRTPVVSVPLPAQGGLVDVFTAMGQSYLRDIQRDLVPRMIARSGYRWHNAAARSEMIQILRYLTIRKGGVYIHWDAIAARSHNLRANNEKALAIKAAGSHARGLRPLRARPAAKLPPSSSECGSGPPIEELGSDRQAPWHRGQASSLKGVSHARVISEVLAQQPYCVNSRSSWQDQPIYRRPTYVRQRVRLCWLLHRGVTDATWRT